MGWFSSFCSSVASAVSSGAEAIGRAASSVYNTAKVVAGRALEWLAEEAEGFVEGVEDVWKTVKPYVEQIRIGLKIGAAAAAGMPWLSGVLLKLEKGLGMLTAFENSPIAKMIKQAIDWGIKTAKRWKKYKEEGKEHENFNEDELKKARKHQEDMRSAEREVMSEEERHQLELASVLNDYEIANADLDKAINIATLDFDHYLRLRATQKLLEMSEKKFQTAKTIDDINSDDIFLVRIASDLIKSNPDLTNAAALRLDRILTEKYGKKLLPFVFEEIIVSWAKKAEVLQKEWLENNKSISKDKSHFNLLKGAIGIQSKISSQEMEIYKHLEVDLPKREKEQALLAASQQDMERYGNAAEGLMQILEKTPEEIEAEDRTYLLEEGTEIGKLLIECAQNGKPFSQLDKEKQSLLTDYANIFKNESKSRMKKLLEVTV